MKKSTEPKVTNKKDRECPDCDGEGQYSFPEAAWMPGDDGWYKCDRCDGTGRVPCRDTGVGGGEIFAQLRKEVNRT
jgi:DnaJ-class molecular chaperone